MNAIFTFIIDSHDSLKLPNTQNLNWDHICVTDNINLTSDVWKIIFIDDIDSKIVCPKRRAMSVMIQFNKYIGSDYDTVISIGGQMTINCNLDNVANIGAEE